MLEHIWNPWHGCKKYSEGCAHCYVFYLDAERGKDASVIYRVKTGFNAPVQKTRDGEFKIKAGSTVHVCLTSDFFLEEADPWRDEAWEIMRRRPDLHFWLQTKRADRVASCLPTGWGEQDRSHISLCFTAENQARADERLPILLSLPFDEKNVMCAPMIDKITLAPYLSSQQIQSVLVDGENYDGRRPLDFEWVEALYKECKQYGVRFNFCGSGNVFVKGGKTFFIPKAYHRVTALRSGLQIPAVSPDIPIQSRCKTCPKRDACNGCNDCGKCTPPTRV